MADQQSPITQESLELCIRNAQIAKNLAIVINGDASKYVSVPGDHDGSKPGNANDVILNNTLSSEIGGEIFRRCLNGQPMHFSSKPKGR